MGATALSQTNQVDLLALLIGYRANKFSKESTAMTGITPSVTVK